MKLSPAESRHGLPQITQIYAESIAQLCEDLRDPTSLRLRRTTDASGQAGLLETNLSFLCVNLRDPRETNLNFLCVNLRALRETTLNFLCVNLRDLRETKP